MPPSRKKTSLTAGPDLHRRWRVVLEDAGLKEATWARNRGRTQSHVRRVILGRADGRALLLEIIAFVEARERVLMERLTAGVAA